MSENASTVPPSGLGTVKFWSDLGKGAFLAVLTNILLALYTIVNNGGLPTHEDWSTILKSTLAILIAYFIKNLSTNNVGQLFTQDKPVVHVDETQFNELKEKAAQADAVPTLSQVK